MTNSEFKEFSALVSQLWPRWAYVDDKNPDRSNWNTTNQMNVYQLFKAHDAKEAEALLRKQRQWEPDANKPEWKPILNELRTRIGERKSPEDIALENRARFDTRRMLAWGRVNQHRLDDIEQEILKVRPRLRNALRYARRVVHSDARVWVCEQWENGERFEEFADAIEPESSQTESVEVPF